MGYIGIIGYILGFYWDNGKENGHYYNVPLGCSDVVLRVSRGWVSRLYGLEGFRV